MITCQTFRATLRPDTNDPEALAHLRACDACIDHALSIDPDNFFRLLGGEEMVPPGGVDAFAADVMSQIRLRQAETSLEARRVFSWPRRLAIAATVAAGMAAASFTYLAERSAPAPVFAAHAHVKLQPVATKAVVETYQSQNATIVEVPSDGANVVMIFDDKLPADL